MPRGDRTGPQGAGPMTGRRLGFCAGNDHPGYGPGYGNGYGHGPGRGRRGGGYGRGFYGYGAGYDYRQPAAISPDNEKEFLEQEIALLNARMKVMKDRLDKLTKEE